MDDREQHIAEQHICRRRRRHSLSGPITLSILSLLLAGAPAARGADQGLSACWTVLEFENQSRVSRPGR